MSNYTASGGVSVGGHAEYKVYYYYDLRFAIGSVVYDRTKAVKGVIEKIFITDVRVFDYRNRVRPPCDLSRLGGLTPLYVDRNNAFYNEDDLCEYAEAVALAEAYVESLEAQLSFLD